MAFSSSPMVSHNAKAMETGILYSKDFLDLDLDEAGSRQIGGRVPVRFRVQCRVWGD